MAAGSLHATALAEALIERSAAREPQLRAWASFDPTEARRRAQALDHRAPPAALFGLPLAVKDNIDTAGIPHVPMDHPVYAGHLPAADAACVALARAVRCLGAGQDRLHRIRQHDALRHAQPPGTRRTRPAGSVQRFGRGRGGRAGAAGAGHADGGFGHPPRGLLRHRRLQAFARPLCHARGVKPNSDTLDEVGVMARSVADAAWLAAVLTGRAQPAALQPRARPISR